MEKPNIAETNFEHSKTKGLIGMADGITIPSGAETVTVVLTVKEAMALGQNVHFAAAAGIEASAKRKVAKSLEQKLIPHAGKIDYHALNL